MVLTAYHQPVARTAVGGRNESMTSLEGPHSAGSAKRHGARGRRAWEAVAVEQPRTDDAAGRDSETPPPGAGASGSRGAPAPHDAPAPDERPDLREAGTTARVQIIVSACLGAAGGVAAALLGTGLRIAPLVGWDVLALVFCGRVWAAVWGLDDRGTRQHALREDPGRDLADLMLLGAALASLVAVGAVLFDAGQQNGAAKYYEAGFALFSVFVSWALVHTVFMLKYARLYYTEPFGGIGFNQDAMARYSDFAYIAFTVGMTFQVSDNEITDGAIRRAVLRQALLSYPLGAVIIAAAINLVSGLAK